MSPRSFNFVGSDHVVPYRLYLNPRKWLKGEVPGNLDIDILDTLQPRPKTKKDRNSRGDFIDAKPVVIRREG